MESADCQKVDPHICFSKGWGGIEASKFPGLFPIAESRATCTNISKKPQNSQYIPEALKKHPCEETPHGHIR